MRIVGICQIRDDDFSSEPFRAQIQNTNNSGQRTNSRIHVVFVSSATPRAMPAAIALPQPARLSQRQNRYPANSPSDAAPESGVIELPQASKWGQKL